MLLGDSAMLKTLFAPGSLPCVEDYHGLPQYSSHLPVHRRQYSTLIHLMQDLEVGGMMHCQYIVFLGTVTTTNWITLHSTKIVFLLGSHQCYSLYSAIPMVA